MSVILCRVISSHKIGKTDLFFGQCDHGSRLFLAWGQEMLSLGSLHGSEVFHAVVHRHHMTGLLFMPIAPKRGHFPDDVAC